LFSSASVRPICIRDTFLCIPRLKTPYTSGHAESRAYFLELPPERLRRLVLFLFTLFPHPGRGHIPPAGRFPSPLLLQSKEIRLRSLRDFVRACITEDPSPRASVGPTEWTGAFLSFRCSWSADVYDLFPFFLRRLSLSILASFLLGKGIDPRCRSSPISLRFDDLSLLREAALPLT